MIVISEISMIFEESEKEKFKEYEKNYPLAEVKIVDKKYILHIKEIYKAK